MEGGHYCKFDIRWQLPVFSSSPLFYGHAELEHAKFSSWCRRFVRLNIAHRAVLHRHIQLPLEVFSALPRSHTPELWTGSASAEESMQVARDAFASGEMVRAVLQELGLAPQPARRESLDSSGTGDVAGVYNPEQPCSMEPVEPAKAGSSKRPASPGPDDMTPSAAELRELNRYFPTVDSDAIFCVGCASYGHRVRFCPLQTCRICGGSLGEHGLFGCPALSPTDVVFRKIAPLKTSSKRHKKGKGKDKGKEPEQGNETPGETAETDSRPAQKCKLCLEVTVHRDVCPLLWTTFVPNAALKRKANHISASCYNCGAEGHFGGDCSKNTGEHLTGRPFSRADDIWRQEYAMQFLGDGVPASQAGAESQPAKAKRAKASTDDNPTPGPAPTQPQSKANGQPGASSDTLSRAQIKKASRRQRKADAARGAQAQQAAQTALPAKAGPPGASPTSSKQAGPKPPPQLQPKIGNKPVPKPAGNAPPAKASKSAEKQASAPAASKKKRSKKASKATASGSTAAPAAEAPQQPKRKAKAKANASGSVQQAKQDSNPGQPPAAKRRRRRGKASGSEGVPAGSQ